MPFGEGIPQPRAIGFAERTAPNTGQMGSQQFINKHNLGRRTPQQDHTGVCSQEGQREPAGPWEAGFVASRG